jgi:hypothetical protein
MATTIKTGETRIAAGAAFCFQCKQGVPTTSPFAVEVTDERGINGYVHGRCKAAWDEAHASPKG